MRHHPTIQSTSPRWFSTHRACSLFGYFLMSSFLANTLISYSPQLWIAHGIATEHRDSWEGLRKISKLGYYIPLRKGFSLYSKGVYFWIISLQQNQKIFSSALHITQYGLYTPTLLPTPMPPHHIVQSNHFVAFRHSTRAWHMMWALWTKTVTASSVYTPHWNTSA